MSAVTHLRDGVGCWAESRARSPERFRGKPALFLDRDGVVIEEKNYLSDPNQVALLPEVAACIAAVNRMGYPAIIVTNQSGIARGYFDWTAFARVMERMHSDLVAHGAAIDFVYACGFHDSAAGALGVVDHPWRKPNPGMLREAASDVGIDIKRSIIVGDKVGDLQAGRSAGLGTGILLAQSYGAEKDEQTRANALATRTFRVDIAEHLTAADFRDFR